MRMDAQKTKNQLRVSHAQLGHRRDLPLTSYSARDSHHHEGYSRPQFTDLWCDNLHVVLTSVSGCTSTHFQYSSLVLQN